MATINFNTSNQTLRQLLGNGLTYRAPRFQRDYSWEEDEWNDLWQDILGTVTPGGESAHYMGMRITLAWNAERIAARPNGMARLATTIWRIDQLS